MDRDRNRIYRLMCKNERSFSEQEARTRAFELNLPPRSIASMRSCSAMPRSINSLESRRIAAIGCLSPLISRESAARTRQGAKGETPGDSPRSAMPGGGNIVIATGYRK